MIYRSAVQTGHCTYWANSMCSWVTVQMLISQLLIAQVPVIVAEMNSTPRLDPCIACTGTS